MNTKVAMMLKRLVPGVLLSMLANAGFAAEQQCSAHYIQLFATSMPAKANTMKMTLSQVGFNALIVPFQHDGNTLYRVRTGPYKSKNIAVAAQGKLKAVLKDNISVQNSIIANGVVACAAVFRNTQPQAKSIQNTEQNVSPILVSSKRFQDYKVPAIYTGKHHALVMNGFGHTFRTRLRAALKESKPSFAGQYIVAGWSCGSSCYTGAVINAETGIATPFPVTLSSVYQRKPEFENEEGQEHIYRLDSRLMVFAGHLGRAAKGDGSDSIEFYEFKDGEFIFIESRPYGRGASN